MTQPNRAVEANTVRVVKFLMCILVLSPLLAGCGSKRTAQSDFYFLPCEAKASVSFEGTTQAGPGVHRLEVRRLAFVPPTTKKRELMMASGVIYYAGDVYGPYILSVLDDCIEPLVMKVSKDVVEVYFLAGAHTHIRQQWRLLGYTAKLEQEGEIDWKDDPRTTASAEQGGAENRR